MLLAARSPMWRGVVDERIMCWWRAQERRIQEQKEKEANNESHESHV